MCASLYSMTDVREITRSDAMRASFAINSSVIPSAKYSCFASPERFFNGSTAIDSIFCNDNSPGAFLPMMRHDPTAMAITANTIAIIHTLRNAAGRVAKAVDEAPPEAFKMSFSAKTRSCAE